MTELLPLEECVGADVEWPGDGTGPQVWRWTETIPLYIHRAGGVRISTVACGWRSDDGRRGVAHLTRDGAEWRGPRRIMVRRLPAGES